MQTRQEIIIAYIEESFLTGNDGNKLSSDDDLLGSGLLDSMGVMKLVGFIEEEFNILVPPEDIIIENFMSVGFIDRYLETRI